MFVRPMKAETLDGLDGTLPGWIVEPKLDGWRCIAGVHDSGAWMETSTGARIRSLPYITGALAKMFPPDTVLDGELVDEYASRDESWNRVQTLASRDSMHIPDSEVDPPLTYFVFDVLVAEGEDVKGLELRKRKSRLFELFDERAGGPSALVKMVFWASASGDAVANLLDAGYEGAVVKDLGSRYRPGVKGHGWCKIKRVDAEDLVCVGWFPAKRGSKYDGKAIGGLLCDRDGTEIRVGTGFDDEDRRRWLEKPSLVVGKVIEVAFNQGATARSRNGQVRNASFVRVRDPRDKAAGDVVHSRQRETRNAKRVPRRQLVREPVTVGAGGASRRNYSAMGEEKLTRCIAELLDERGDAYDRAVGAGADPAADLAKAIEIANEKGWA